MNIVRRKTAELIGRILGLSYRTKEEIIINLIKENNFKKYAEIGVWKGELIRYLLGHSKLKVIYGIDPYEASNYKDSKIGLNKFEIKQVEYEKIYKHTKELEGERFNLLREKSITASKLFKDNYFDIIFIDGNHNYKSVKEDIKAWLPKVRKGGIICGHDYCLEHFGVIKAVNEVFGCDRVTLKSSRVWMVEKECNKKQ